MRMPRNTTLLRALKFGMDGTGVEPVTLRVLVPLEVWALQESNLRPCACEAHALTN